MGKNETALAQRATVKTVMFFWVLTAPALQLVLPTGGASASARASASSTTASSPKNLPSTPPAHPGGPVLRVPQLAGAGGTARGVSGKMKMTSAAAVSAMAGQGHQAGAPAVDDFPELSAVTRDGTLRTSNTSKSKSKRKPKRNKGAAQQGANAQGPAPVDEPGAYSGCAQKKLLEVADTATGSCKAKSSGAGGSCEDKDSTLEQSTSQHSPDIYFAESSAAGQRHMITEEVGHQPEDHEPPCVFPFEEEYQQFQAEFQGMQMASVVGRGAPASTTKVGNSVEDGRGLSAASAPPTAPVDHERPTRLEDHEEALQLPDVDHENLSRLQTPESNTWGHHPGLKNFPNLQGLFFYNSDFLQEHELGVGAEHASRAGAAGCSGAPAEDSTSSPPQAQPPGTVTNLAALLEAEAEEQQKSASKEEKRVQPGAHYDRPDSSYQETDCSTREQDQVVANPSSLEETQSQNAFSYPPQISIASI